MQWATQLPVYSCHVSQLSFNSLRSLVLQVSIFTVVLVSPWCVAKSFHLPLVSLLGILLSLSIIRVMVPPSEWPALQRTHQLLKYRSPYDFIVGCLFL